MLGANAFAFQCTVEAAKRQLRNFVFTASSTWSPPTPLAYGIGRLRRICGWCANPSGAALRCQGIYSLE